MRRSRVDIIIDILEAAREGANKTSIVYKTNLNFKLADEFLNLLQKHSLLENKSDADMKIKYITTVKGKTFLKKTQEITLYLEIPSQTQEFWPFVSPSQS
jgi:predicted transcriptional regulator